MPRLRLDPLSPSGVSVASDAPARTVTNAVPRLQTLDDLQDVVISGTPTDNQALAYDTATGKWIPQTVSGGAGGVNETNLTASRTASSVTVASDTGTDAVLAAADTTNAGVMTASDKTKLDGIATGATANDTDANLKNRANHTGTQPASTISDFTTAAAAAAPIQSVVAGTNVTVDTTDPANPIISATGGGGGSGTELNDGSTKLSLADPVGFGPGYAMIEDIAAGGYQGFVSPSNFAFYTHTNTDGSGTWYPYFSAEGENFDFYNEPTTGGSIRFKSGSGGVKFGTGEYPEATFTTDNLTAARSLQFPNESGILVTKSYVDTAVAGGGGTVADATTTTKGIVQLAGDLGGTATAPTVPGLATKAPLASPNFTGTATAPTVATDTINEKTAGSGVTVDGVVLKDSGATLAGPLAVQYGYPSFRVKNTDATQYAGAGFFLTNTASTMGNQAGVTHYMGINDAGATQGFYAIDKTDTTGGGTGHLMLFDYTTNTAQIYQPLTVGTAGSTLGTIKLAGNTSGTTTLTPASAASGTLTLPSATDTLVGRATTDTLTNKTLSAPVLSGTVTGTYTLGGTPTFPATVVSTTGTQTLTNKTLTAPTISSPTGLVKADVGLGNVDNTSDDTKNSATATLTNKTFGDYIQVQGSASAPSTPASGFAKITGAGSTTVRPRFINSSGTIESILTSNDVKRQDNTTNSTLSAGVRIETGWGYATGTGLSFADKAVTFSSAFSTTPVIIVTGIGYKDTTNPTSITDFGAWEVPNTSVYSQSTTGFTMRGGTIDGTTIASSRRIGFTWIAIGV